MKTRQKTLLAALDVISDYGEVLERSSGLVKLESKLPHPKHAIKSAILKWYPILHDEKLRRRITEEYPDPEAAHLLSDDFRDSLGTGYVMLANFIPDAEARRFAAWRKIQKEMLEQGPDEFDELSAKLSAMGDLPGLTMEKIAEEQKRLRRELEEAKRSERRAESPLEQKARASGSFPLGMIQQMHSSDALIEYGAALIVQGKTAFDEWSAHMVGEFGESIEPYLEVIFQEAERLRRKAFELRATIREAVDSYLAKEAPPESQPEVTPKVNQERRLEIQESSKLSPRPAPEWAWTKVWAGLKEFPGALVEALVEGWTSFFSTDCRSVNRPLKPRDRLVEFDFDYDDCVCHIVMFRRDNLLLAAYPNNLLVAAYLLFLARYFYICDDRQVPAMKRFLLDFFSSPSPPGSFDEMREQIYDLVMTTLRPAERQAARHLIIPPMVVIGAARDSGRSLAKYEFAVFQREGSLLDFFHMSRGPDILLLPMTVSLFLEYVVRKLEESDSYQKLASISVDFLRTDLHSLRSTPTALGTIAQEVLARHLPSWWLSECSRLFAE